ncbi:MAG: hypothetical protein J7500_17765 [Sphingomonas sp.]|uniref:DUF6916 family protein n=1 Tax=Sphingomonas sp. TaxID=28214 RepID=UPI001AFD4E64|nr:hypothetical protein [Sphingomonas sp.]MBO9624559.1 hypothetical protein [Sphingomonas sp.]
MRTDTESSRRSFVLGGLASVAATSLAGCGSAGSGSVAAPPAQPVASAPPVPLTRSEVEDWEKLVGTSFLIMGEAGNAPATLAALERSPADPNRPADLARHQPFIAYFEMDSRLVPTGGKTYQLSHPTRGLFDLFLGQPGTVQGKGVVLAVLA